MISAKMLLTSVSEGAKLGQAKSQIRIFLARYDLRGLVELLSFRCGFCISFPKRGVIIPAEQRYRRRNSATNE